MKKIIGFITTTYLLTLSLSSYAVVLEILDDEYRLSVSHDTYHYGYWDYETQASKDITGQYFDYVTGGISDLPKSVSAGPEDTARVSITGYSNSGFIPYVYTGGWDSCYKGNSDGELCHTGSAYADFSLTLRPLDEPVSFSRYDYHNSSFRSIVDLQSGEQVRELLPGKTYQLKVQSSQSSHGSSRNAGLEALQPVEWRVVKRDPVAVPEPGPWVLMILGLLVAFLARFKRSNSISVS